MNVRQIQSRSVYNLNPYCSEDCSLQVPDGRFDRGEVEVAVAEQMVLNRPLDDTDTSAPLDHQFILNLFPTKTIEKYQRNAFDTFGIAVKSDAEPDELESDDENNFPSASFQEYSNCSP
ncbi:hypothetical protein PoB_006895900 [Plakobranchus ocellatus]|uniref:Uncharacterized protein n=1 Tax=Plakobranchus ocellatus TaxID=259542 RepID=A0AAV4DE22_9GAST|nr:hypothetical protein PoB_006895900 [Plakobranchus ocellatus]